MGCLAWFSSAACSSACRPCRTHYDTGSPPSIMTQIAKTGLLLPRFRPALSRAGGSRALEYTSAAQNKLRELP